VQRPAAKVEEPEAKPEAKKERGAQRKNKKDAVTETVSWNI
jgi:hypothetical protein